MIKPNRQIDSLIRNMRGQKVILDADLAELYGVPTMFSIRRSNGTPTVFRKISSFNWPAGNGPT